MSVVVTEQQFAWVALEAAGKALEELSMAITVFVAVESERGPAVKRLAKQCEEIYRQYAEMVNAMQVES